MIVYAKFEVDYHGLDIQTPDQMDELWRALRDAAAKILEEYPYRNRDLLPGDCAVDFVQHAGKYE